MPLGLPSKSVVVEPYDPEWPRLFEEERQRIVAAIGHIVAGVHHVGSTSIPGMAAKPVIDIAVLLHDFDDGERCIEPLEKIGYEHRGLSQDIPGDRFFRRGDPRSYHLHMYAVDSPIRADHFNFRDYLIAHSEVAMEYADLKLALAERYPKDRPSYIEAKAPFVKGVLENAAKEFGTQDSTS
jgi:GrpB-like predicted nucleotidyltransferase (UPF0157 family)